MGSVVLASLAELSLPAVLAKAQTSAAQSRNPRHCAHGQAAPNLRLSLRGRSGMVISMAGGPGAPGAGALVDESGSFTLAAESLDTRTTPPTKTVEVPDVESHALDVDDRGSPVADRCAGSSSVTLERWASRRSS